MSRAGAARHPSFQWRIGGMAGGGQIQSVELVDHPFRVSSKRIQPVDDEAPQPGVGAVPQQGPDFLGFAHANQGDRRPSLTSASRSLVLLGDHRAVPDRGGHRRSIGCGAASRPGYGAVILGDELPAFSQVVGGIKTGDRARLEACIARPYRRIPAVGVTGLNDLGECCVVPDRVEARVLVHPSEIGVVVLDCLPEQLERSLRKLTPLRLVRAGDGF